jgi:hypothetical protein
MGTQQDGADGICTHDPYGPDGSCTHNLRSASAALYLLELQARVWTCSQLNLSRPVALPRRRLVYQTKRSIDVFELFQQSRMLKISHQHQRLVLSRKIISAVQHD